MVNEMLQLLRKRAHFHHQQERLQQVMERGELSEDQYAALSAKYTREQHEIDAEIALLKEHAQERLRSLRATLDEFERQLTGLQEALTQGRLSSRQFQSRVEKVQAQRSACPAQEEIPLLEALVRAKSAVDLAGLEEDALPPQIAPPLNAPGDARSPAGWGHRSAVFCIGLTILLSVFLPAFPRNILPEPASATTLFAFSLANLSESGFPLLIAAIPAGFGLLVLLTAAVSHRMLRGSILLAEGIMGMMFLAVSAAFVVYFPWPGLGLDNVARWWIPYPPPGMALMIAAFCAAYGLSLVHLRHSRVMIVVWLLSFLFVLLAASVAGAAFRFGAHASASASLELTEITVALKTERMDKPAEAILDAAVTNNGNVPLFLRPELPEQPVRSEFGLALQQQLPGKEWMPGEGEFDCTQVVPVNKAVHLPIRILLPRDGAPVTYRLRLTGVDGVARFSNEITVEAPQLPQDGLSPAPATTLDVFPQGELAPPVHTAQEGTARAAVEDLEQQLAKENPSALIPKIDAAREAMDKLPEETRQGLDERLDQAISGAKDRIAREWLKKAETAMTAATFSEVMTAVDSLFDLYDLPPVTRSLPWSYDAQEMMNAAQQLYDQAALAGDPAVRFRVTGFMETGPMGPVAFLVDNLTGESLRVRQGSVLGDYTVADLHNRRVILKKGENTWEIR